MNSYTVHVKVMPVKDLLDPQGKAVQGGLAKLGLKEIRDVRIGKYISLHISATSHGSAKNIAEKAAKKLLANPVIESYEIILD